MGVNYLLNNVSANTDGAAVQSDGARKQVFVYATSFGGGSITLQARAGVTGSPWITLTLPDGAPAIFTSNVTRVIDYIAQGCEIRATLTGATSPSGVYVVTF